MVVSARATTIAGDSLSNITHPAFGVLQQKGCFRRHSNQTTAQNASKHGQVSYGNGPSEVCDDGEFLGTPLPSEDGGIRRDVFN